MSRKWSLPCKHVSTNPCIYNYANQWVFSLESSPLTWYPSWPLDLPVCPRWRERPLDTPGCALDWSSLRTQAEEESGWRGCTLQHIVEGVVTLSMETFIFMTMTSSCSNTPPCNALLPSNRAFYWGHTRIITVYIHIYTHVDLSPHAQVVRTVTGHIAHLQVIFFIASDELDYCQCQH